MWIMFPRHRERRRRWATTVNSSGREALRHSRARRVLTRQRLVLVGPELFGEVLERRERDRIVGHA